MRLYRRELAGWVDGWMNGWMGGQVNGQMVSWVGGQLGGGGWEGERALPHSGIPTDKYEGSGEKSSSYTCHGKELFSKNHPLTINFFFKNISKSLLLKVSSL